MVATITPPAHDDRALELEAILEAVTDRLEVASPEQAPRLRAGRRRLERELAELVA